MLNKNRVLIMKWFIMTIDIVLLVISFFVAYEIRNCYFSKFGALNNITQSLWVMLIIIPVWIIAFYFMGLYKMRLSIFIVIFRAFLSICIGSVAVAAIFYFIKNDSLSRLFYGILSVVFLSFIIVSRVIFKSVLYLMTQNKKMKKKVLVVGTNSLAFKFTNYIKENPVLMIDIVGYVQVAEIAAHKEFNILGRIEDISEILKKNVVDEVVFALSRDYIEDLEPYIYECEIMGITVSMITNLFNFKNSKVKLGNLGSLPVITFHTVSLDHRQLICKRIIDIIGSFIGVVLTGILFIFLAPLIYLESPGPIFFWQDRVGLNGRIFKCYKFRSMTVDAEDRKKELLHLNEMDGMIFKIKDDPRVTRIGKFIRATSLDEFPQFWNVLKGDMSLVGTRPPTVDEVMQYKNYHWRRLSIKPGLTGLWQVSGRNKIEDFEEIVKLDTSYIDNWSIGMDFKLIFKTFKIVVAKTGAS